MYAHRDKCTIMESRRNRLSKREVYLDLVRNSAGVCRRQLSQNLQAVSKLCLKSLKHSYFTNGFEKFNFHQPYGLIFIYFLNTGDRGTKQTQQSKLTKIWDHKGITISRSHDPQVFTSPQRYKYKI